MSIIEKSKTHYLSTSIKGLFWSIPIILIVAIIYWLYSKIQIVTGLFFKLMGIVPENNIFMWTCLGLLILGFIIYIVGHLVETKLAYFIQKGVNYIPVYQTIKHLVNIFNSSKKGEQSVLVVLIRGFSDKGYNIGLMYSTKESIVKDHYTVVLSQTPIPNGGYMFEEHKDNIYVIEEAKFDDNLQYLFSMGTKSLTEIIGIKPVDKRNLKTLTEYLNLPKTSKLL